MREARDGLRGSAGAVLQSVQGCQGALPVRHVGWTWYWQGEGGGDEGQGTDRHSGAPSVS